VYSRRWPGREKKISEKTRLIAALIRWRAWHTFAGPPGLSVLRCGPYRSRKVAKTAIGYLEKAEMDALLNQPDKRTSLGVRDHALLLFLYNSGARADEAAKLTVGNLQLSASPSVRLRGKGNKFRLCLLWLTTATSLARLVTGMRMKRSFLDERTSL